MTGMPAHKTQPVAGASRGFGDNLLLLLDLAAGGRVLILGEALRGWNEVFEAAEHHAGLPDSLPEGAFDLVLYHADCAPDVQSLPTHLGIVRTLLAATGWLLLFAPNGMSPVRLKGASTAHGRSGFRPDQRRGRYRQFLNAAGFGVVREYLACPGLDAIEELTAPASRFLEVSHERHPLLRLAGRAGLLPAVAEGAVFFAGPSEPERHRLGRAVNAARAAAMPDAAAARIERIDLRARGALVLFCSDSRAERDMIVRVASDPAVRSTVHRNRVFLQALWKNTRLPNEVRKLLPRPLAEFNLCGRSVQMESLLPGRLAWKVNRRGLRERIYRGAAEFLWRFQLASRVETCFSGGVSADLFAEDLERLENCPAASGTLRRRAAETRAGLVRLLAGHRVRLAAAHGDFGYGNILVDPRRGDLTGVIDWDTGRLRDLPGIDLINLDVQRIRSERNAGVFDAFVEASRPILARGGLDPGGAYAAEFAVTPERLPELLHACLLRYLCRAARYPEVLAAEQEDYLKTLDYLGEVAAL